MQVGSKDYLNTREGGGRVARGSISAGLTNWPSRWDGLLASQSLHPNLGWIVPASKPGVDVSIDAWWYESGPWYPFFAAFRITPLSHMNLSLPWYGQRHFSHRNVTKICSIHAVSPGIELQQRKSSFRKVTATTRNANKKIVECSACKKRPSFRQ